MIHHRHINSINKKKIKTPHFENPGKFGISARIIRLRLARSSPRSVGRCGRVAPSPSSNPQTIHTTQPKPSHIPENPTRIANLHRPPKLRHSSAFPPFLHARFSKNRSSYLFRNSNRTNSGAAFPFSAARGPPSPASPRVFAISACLSLSHLWALAFCVSLAPRFMRNVNNLCTFSFPPLRFRCAHLSRFGSLLNC